MSCINYSVFNDEQILELSKTPYSKYGNKAIKILEYLIDKNPRQLCIKKELRSLFDESAATTDKVIDTLEDVLAISYQVVSTSHVYEITPIGIKMLEILKKKKGEGK